MKEEIRKELDSLGSKLGEKKLNQNFQVPEGYFEDMQEEVMQKISSQHTPSRQLVRFSKWTYAVAAVIILLIAALFIFEQPANKGNIDFDQLETDAIYAYLDENLEGVSLNMLVDESNYEETVLMEEQDAEILQKYLEENLDELPLETLEELF